MSAKKGALVLYIKENRYYIIDEPVVGGNPREWVCHPADCRFVEPVSLRRLTENDFQILAAPKEPWLAIALREKAAIQAFKGYPDALAASANGPTDLGLVPGDTYMVCQHRMVSDGWQPCNVRYYVTSDDMHRNHPADRRVYPKDDDLAVSPPGDFE